MPAIIQTSKEYLRALMIVYVALIMGQVMFMAVSIYLNVTAGSLAGPDESFASVMNIVAIFFSLGGILGGYFSFRKSLEKASVKENLNEKLQSYRAALIVRSALLEGPSFFGIVGYLLLGDYLLLIHPFVIIGIFFLWWPSKNRLQTELNLNGNEIAKLDNPNTEFEFTAPKKF